MIGTRLKQFREYNGFHIEAIAQMLHISPEKYIAIEEGKATADIDTLTVLANYYRVTVNELYGYTPRLSLYDKNIESQDEAVEGRLLKMADLSWDEAQIILYYRSLEDKADCFKDELISEIIKRNNKNK